MLASLRSRWRADLSFDALIALRADLDTMLHQIRSERQIHPPMVRCPHCGQVGDAAEPEVSVRAMILSLV
jgi:hypothetical protein